MNASHGDSRRECWVKTSLNTWHLNWDCGGRGAQVVIGTVKQILQEWDLYGNFMVRSTSVGLRRWFSGESACHESLRNGIWIPRALPCKSSDTRMPLTRWKWRQDSPGCCRSATPHTQWLTIEDPDLSKMEGKDEQSKMSYEIHKFRGTHLTNLPHTDHIHT